MNKSPARKSDRTRAAILNAAQRLFAERGYDGTTVRDIAAAAGIDAALVVRYFGGKDELFAEAAQVDLALPDLAGIDESVLGETLARHFLKVWAGPHGGGLITLIRSAPGNAHAAETARRVFAAQVLPALMRSPVGQQKGFERKAMLVSSQILGFAYARYVLKLPALTEMEDDEVVATLGGALQAILSSSSL